MPNTIITQDRDGQELFNAISSFILSFKIGTLLRRCNAQKEKGVPVLDIFRYKLCNVFPGRSMYMQQKTGSYQEKFSKNTFYRFMNNAKTNWLRFTSLLSKTVVYTIQTLTDKDRVNAFVVDDVMVRKDKKIPARIVCVRNKNNKKDWIVLICTDPSVSEEEIIRIYGKRWRIEVFFKTCKSYLSLIGECHSLSYDALTAHVAIVFTRCLMIALEQRNEDDRTLG